MTLHRKKKAFTLIELMVVVGLIGLIMLFAIPAFQGADRSGRLRTAVFQLNTTFNMVRQLAITKRDYVYVVLPDDSATLYLSPNQDFVQNALRSYAIYSERDGYIGEWRTLPQGVLFDPLYGVPTKNVFGLGGGTGALKTIPFPYNTNATKQVHALGYRPDGPISLGGAVPVSLYLSEGWMDYEITSSKGTVLGKGFRTNVVVSIEFNAVTGQSRTREMY